MGRDVLPCQTSQINVCCDNKKSLQHLCELLVRGCVGSPRSPLCTRLRNLPARPVHRHTITPKPEVLADPHGQQVQVTHRKSIYQHLRQNIGVSSLELMLSWWRGGDRGHASPGRREFVLRKLQCTRDESHTMEKQRS